MQELTFDNLVSLLKLIAQQFYPDESRLDEENYQEFLRYMELDNLDKVSIQFLFYPKFSKSCKKKCLILSKC